MNCELCLSIVNLNISVPLRFNRFTVGLNRTISFTHFLSSFALIFAEREYVFGFISVLLVVFFLVEVRVPPCMRVDAIDVTAVCVTLEHVESAENLSFSSK